jgi:hypothetical protein
MRLWWPCPICCNGKNMGRLLAVVGTAPAEGAEGEAMSLPLTFADLILLCLCAFAGGVAVGVTVATAYAERAVAKLLADLGELRP